MKLFINIRVKIGKAFLARKMVLTKREVIYSNINLIKNIGIVWDASNAEEFAALSRFHQKMNDRGIEVKILGYFQGKELPDRYTAIRYLTCIRRKEISFFYLPFTDEVVSFLAIKFDVLIDINFKKIFPLEYISTLSSAGLKTGLFDSEASTTPFDLMMEIKNIRVFWR